MNKKRRIFIGVVSALLVALMLFSLVMGAIPALAVSQSDIDALEEEKERLAEQSAQQQEVIDQLNASKALFVDRKMALDQQIELNRQEIALITSQIQLYDQLISEKEQELEEALAAETAQGELLRARMRVMEENGNWSYVAILFEATSFTDLLSRVADITDIMHYDQELEEQYMSTRADVEAIKEDYETAQAERQEIKKELESKQARLDAQVEAAYTLLADIDSLADDAEAEREAIAEEEKRLEEEIDELVRELWAQEAAASGGGTSGGTSGGGGNTSGIGSSNAVDLSSLTWPTPSCSYITSRFGYRTQPTAGASTYHQGLDIGAAAGATILAAASGTVEIAYYYGGYGNCVLINHGGGVSTLYGHMSSIAVSTGQYVSQGQVIGYVGSTGVSTGPHLHFEVRVNGALVDPAAYFSGLTYSPSA